MAIVLQNQSTKTAVLQLANRRASHVLFVQKLHSGIWCKFPKIILLWDTRQSQLRLDMGRLIFLSNEKVSCFCLNRQVQKFFFANRLSIVKIEIVTQVRLFDGSYIAFNTVSPFSIVVLFSNDIFAKNFPSCKEEASHFAARDEHKNG